MFQQDYVLRLIESFGAFIRKLLEGTSENIEEMYNDFGEIRDEYAKYVGANSRVIDILSTESIVDVLQKEKNDWLPIVLTANIFWAEAELEALNGNDEDAYFDGIKARELMDYYVNSGYNLDCDDYLTDYARFEKWQRD